LYQLTLVRRQEVDDDPVGIGEVIAGAGDVLIDALAVGVHSFQGTAAVVEFEKRKMNSTDRHLRPQDLHNSG
jgi:hypothetical protein